MNSNKPLQISVFTVAVAGILIGAPLAFAGPFQQQGEQQSQSQQEQSQQGAQQQTPAPDQPQTPPDPSAPKKKKVWTNDEVIQLRTPADAYQFDREQQEAAAEAALAREAAIRAAAKSDKQAPSVIKMPVTVEETQAKIKDTQDDIEGVTQVRDKMRNELADAPADLQDAKQREIDRLTTMLGALQRNLKALQDHLQAITPKPGPAAPTSPPPSF
jgi:chromosome segregation ATPase